MDQIIQQNCTMTFCNNDPSAINVIHLEDLRNAENSLNDVDKKKTKRTVKHDPFVGSRSVEGLDPRNFEEFLGEKTVSMVMFYDSSDPQCEWSKKHLLKAAKTTRRENHGYGAVDCVREDELCAKEGITSLPSFKLYVGARPVDVYSKPKEMTYHDIRRFVESMVVTPDAPPSSPCIKEREKEGGARSSPRSRFKY
ncbi:protein disulfide-isomerase a5 [Plakobranchus ocellatus]|uniref:Protein disulfide-isomerase a5 n=1 Tax=Plakobranchus ocellatus TaxID=259542 RepID=A0AAV4C1I8_9GAST|nr:protein disulfide-isomerase a5 [Plakobranchus ocellatus]